MPVYAYNSNDQQIFDSDTLGEGVCIGTMSALPGTVNQRAFPSLTGMTLMAFSSVNAGAPSSLYVSYPNGVPTVTIAPNATEYADYVTLWAYGARTVEPASGIYATTPNNWMSIGPETFGVHYAGQAVFTGHTASWGDQQYGVLGHSSLYFDCPTPPVLVSRVLPGEAVSVVWVRPMPGVPGRWEILARRVTPREGSGALPWHDLLPPVIYCFARKQYASEPAGALVFEEGTNQVAWNLAEPGLLYPTKRISLPLGYSDGAPAGITVGVCGTPRGYYILPEDERFNFPPEYHWDNYMNPMWALSADGQSLTCKLLRHERTEPQPGQGSPNYIDAISDAIIVNLGAY